MDKATVVVHSQVAIANEVKAISRHQDPLNPKELALVSNMETTALDELEVASKYGLFWANALVEDEDGTLLADGFYLSEPQRFSDTFFTIFDKLRQLNDYCFNQLLASEARLRSLTSQRTSTAANKNCRAEEFDYLDDQIPLWEDNVEVVGRTTPIILLCSFLEWGLKLVAKELTGVVPRNRGHAISDFEFLLKYIREKAGLTLVIDAELTDNVHVFRDIRNAFAHGQWVALSERLDGIPLRVCFETVAQVFQRIEEAAWQSPWGETSS
ncbi:hypothetical protein [Stenotrophomonas thermophila]|nr:hypothetical protein BN126350049 [Stenotrophomonas maltophilia]